LNETIEGISVRIATGGGIGNESARRRIDRNSGGGIVERGIEIKGLL
jgi:hypothetical protein